MTRATLKGDRTSRQDFRQKNFFHDFFRNDPYRSNFMREIDCAHYRSVKMLPWPWFREIDVCIEAKIENFWNFSLKIIFLGVISCGESIARISEPWKSFLKGGGGKNAVRWRRKNFFFNFSKNDPTTPNFMRKIDCAHSQSLKMLPWPWFREIRVCIEAKIQHVLIYPESGSGKRFQASRMRAIDSPHEITPRNMMLREKFQNFSIFASIHTSISLNQGQGSIFTFRECAQSIFRMILGLYRLFWQKKIFSENPP